MKRSIGIVVCLGSLALLCSRADAQLQGNQTTNGQGQTESGLGQPADIGQDVAGTISGDERFLRENRQAGQIVGGSRAGVGNIQETQQQMGQQPTSRTQFGGQFSPFNQFNNFNQLYGAAAINQLSNQRAQLRMPVSLGFQPRQQSLITPAVREQRIQTRFARIPRVREMGSVSVDIREGTAILSGAVGSEDDRRLLAKLLLLEPGVSEVQNDLVVQDELPLPPAN